MSFQAIRDLMKQLNVPGLFEGKVASMSGVRKIIDNIVIDNIVLFSPFFKICL